MSALLAGRGRRRLAHRSTRSRRTRRCCCRRWSSRCSSSSPSRAACRASATSPGFDFPSGYTAFQFVFVLLQASAFGGVFTGFGIAARLRDTASRGGCCWRRRTGSAIIAGYAIAAALRGRRSSACCCSRSRCSPACRSAATASTWPALVAARGPDRELRRDAVGGGRRDAPAVAAGRPADADAGVPGAVPRAGLRAAGPARGLGRTRSAEGQPVHAADRGGPRLDLRRRRRTAGLAYAVAAALVVPVRLLGACAGCAAPRRPAARRPATRRHHRGVCCSRSPSSTASPTARST